MREQPTTLIMLPGLDGTGMVFEPILEYLPDTIDPVIVRYPTDRLMSFSEHVAYAAKHLPRDKPFVLLAESFSGPVGLQILAQAPDNLTGIIFVATFARYPKPFLLDVAKVLPQPPLAKLFATTPCCRFFCLGSSSREAVTLFQRALARVQVKVLSHRLKLLAELPPPPETNQRNPALYIQASHDHLVPERAAIQLQKHLPQLQVIKIRGPHIILLAQPQRGAQIITDFIARLPERS